MNSEEESLGHFLFSKVESSGIIRNLIKSQNGNIFSFHGRHKSYFDTCHIFKTSKSGRFGIHVISFFFGGIGTCPFTTLFLPFVFIRPVQNITSKHWKHINYYKSRMYHLSPQHGIVLCIHVVFQQVSTLPPGQTVVYINNSTPGGLRKALAESQEPWVKDVERMKAFHYERVTSLTSVLEVLDQNHDLVIIEQLDRIVQEPTDLDYKMQNRLLAEILRRAHQGIFIDDWNYLRRYYVLEDLGT